MMKAIWHETTLADSDDTVVVEGNHYFLRESVDRHHLRASDHSSVCPWKGTASYYDVVVDGATNENAAWTYPDPKEAAKQIAGRIAFWKGVAVID